MFMDGNHRLSIANAHVRKISIWNPLQIHAASIYHLHGVNNIDHSFDQWMLNAHTQNISTAWIYMTTKWLNWKKKKADDLWTRPPKVSFASWCRAEAKRKKMNYINILASDSRRSAHLNDLFQLQKKEKNLHYDISIVVCSSFSDVRQTILRYHHHHHFVRHRSEHSSLNRFEWPCQFLLYLCGTIFFFCFFSFHYRVIVYYYLAFLSRYLFYFLYSIETTNLLTHTHTHACTVRFIQKTFA